MSVPTAKMQEFAGKMLGDVGAAMSGALVLIGDKLGLYKALAAAGPLTFMSLLTGPLVDTTAFSAETNFSHRSVSLSLGSRERVSR